MSEAALTVAPDPADFTGSRDYAAMDAVWSAHLRQRRAPAGDCARVAKLPLQVLRRYFQEAGTFRTVRALADPRLAADASSIDWTAFMARFEAFLSLPPEGAPYWLRAATFPSTMAAEVVGTTERHCAYQERILADRDILFPDPFGPGNRAVRDFYQIYGRGTYLYGGAAPFYLLTAGAGQKATALVLPSLALTIDLGASIPAALTEESLANSFAPQLKRLASEPDRFEAVMARDEGTLAKRRIVMLAGQIENFAHHLWNFFSGIERIVEGGLAERVDEVRSFGTQFFGPLEGVFPELAGRVAHVQRGGLVAPATPFAGDELMFQPGGYYVPERLQRRVLDAAARTSARPPAPTDAPVVWFGLRVGSRAWLDQAEGVVSLSRSILAARPDAQIVLDGFSYPVGEDHVSAKWQPAIDELTALGERIAAGTGSPSLVNLIGRPLDEALLWAARTTTYVAPIGTTQHKVGWFSRGRGITYSGPQIERIWPLRRPGCWEAEGIRPADYLIGAPVEAGERRSEHDRRNNLENITLDLERLRAMLLDAIV